MSQCGQMFPRFRRNRRRGSWPPNASELRETSSRGQRIARKAAAASARRALEPQRRAAGVRSFVHELKADVERRRAEANSRRSRELAAGRRSTSSGCSSPRFARPSTPRGDLLDSLGRCDRWPMRALQRMVALGQRLRASPQPANTMTTSRRPLCRLTGAEAATVVTVTPAHLAGVRRLGAPERKCWSARAEVGDVEPGCSLAELAASAAAKLHEVGAVNRTSAADYEAAVTEQTAVLFKHTPDSYRIVGEKAAAEFEELVATRPAIAS